MYVNVLFSYLSYRLSPPQKYLQATDDVFPIFSLQRGSEARRKCRIVPCPTLPKSRAFPRGLASVTLAIQPVLPRMLMLRFSIGLPVIREDMMARRDAQGLATAPQTDTMTAPPSTAMEVLVGLRERRAQITQAFPPIETLASGIRYLETRHEARGLF